MIIQFNYSTRPVIIWLLYLIKGPAQAQALAHRRTGGKL